MLSVCVYTQTQNTKNYKVCPWNLSFMLSCKSTNLSVIAWTCGRTIQVAGFWFEMDSPKYTHTIPTLLFGGFLFGGNTEIIESQYISSWKGPTRTESNSWIPSGKRLREQDKDLVNAEWLFRGVLIFHCNSVNHL